MLRNTCFFFKWKVFHLVSGLPGMQYTYTPVNVVREPNWRQQTSIGCSNFVPDVLFQTLMRAEISSHTLRLTIVPTDSQARTGQKTWLVRRRHQTWKDASGTHGSKLIYVLCTRWDRLGWNQSSPSASSASTSVCSIARYRAPIRITVQLPCFARQGDHSPDVMHQQLPPFSTGNLPGSGLGGRPKIHSPGPPTRKLPDSAQYCLVQAFVITAMNVRVTQEQKDFSTSSESFNATCCTEIVKWSHKPREL